jgi:hypothetical protein
MAHRPNRALLSLLRQLEDGTPQSGWQHAASGRQGRNRGGGGFGFLHNRGGVMSDALRARGAAATCGSHASEACVDSLCFNSASTRKKHSRDSAFYVFYIHSELEKVTQGVPQQNARFAREQTDGFDGPR